MRIRTFHRSFHAILVISFVLCVMAVVRAQPELDITFNDNLGRIVIAGYTGSSQSKFAVARLYTRDPILASITGRILTPEGVPIRGVSVGLSNSAGETLWTLSSPFGYYQFADIMTGQTYTVHVSSKRYLVQDKMIGLNEELTDLDLTGTPRTENAGKAQLEKLKR